MHARLISLAISKAFISHGALLNTHGHLVCYFSLPLHTRLISLAISKACSKLGVAVEVQQLSWISAKGLEITFVKVCTKEGIKTKGHVAC